MLRRVTLIFVFSLPVFAAVWPPQIGDQTLKSEQPIQITSDRDLWNEYGFVAATQADYGSFQATAYRFKDGTDAFAAAPWIAASNNTPPVIRGNYVITCTGRCPAAKVFQELDLPDRRRSEEPLVWDYLPARGMVPKSARYALGGIGLQKFTPAIPPGVAAFQYGTEVTSALYNTPKGPLQLVLMAFPIPQIARKELAEAQKLPGAQVKRTGPLIAIVPNPPDPASAQQLLSEINYQAQVSRDEQPPPKVTAQGVASMVLTILKLAGVLILFCLFAGLSFAGFQQIRKRLGYENAGEAMIVLHLLDR